MVVKCTVLFLCNKINLCLYNNSTIINSYYHDDSTHTCFRIRSAVCNNITANIYIGLHLRETRKLNTDNTGHDTIYNTRIPKSDI